MGIWLNNSDNIVEIFVKDCTGRILSKSIFRQNDKKHRERVINFLEQKYGIKFRLDGKTDWMDGNEW